MEKDPSRVGVPSCSTTILSSRYVRKVEETGFQSPPLAHSPSVWDNHDEKEWQEITCQRHTTKGFTGRWWVVGANLSSADPAESILLPQFSDRIPSSDRGYWLQVNTALKPLLQAGSYFRTGGTFPWRHWSWWRAVWSVTAHIWVFRWPGRPHPQMSCYGTPYVCVGICPCQLLCGCFVNLIQAKLIWGGIHVWENASKKIGL